MRPLDLAFALSLGIFSPLFPCGAWSQTPGPGCLSPLPQPPGAGPEFAATPTTTRPAEDPPELIATDQGHLCRRFRVEPSIRVDEQAATDRVPSPGKGFLLSAALPGAGQWYLGQNRWPAYLAVEAWAWLQFIDWRRKGHRLQGQYRDLAWFVARRVSTGRRTEAGWDYYEALTKFQSSGAYDADPLTAGVQPEQDPRTFNGSIWVLAQEIYIPQDPEIPVDEGSEPYQQAFDYYMSRAYAPAFAWDWGSNTLHKEKYGILIREADEALRSSTGMIGVILANHLLSAVDALVSGRLGVAGEQDPTARFLLQPGPFDARSAAFQLRIPDPFSHAP